MRFLTVTAAVAGLMLSVAAAKADCTPLKSDVVSLGEKAARFYSERSLQNAVEEERQRISASGGKTGRVSKAMDCQPYPNLIGADEWRCVGAATVCSK